MTKIEQSKHISRAEVAAQLKTYIRPDRPRGYARINLDELVEAIVAFASKHGFSPSEATFFALGYGLNFVEVITHANGEETPKLSIPTILEELEKDVVKAHTQTSEE